MNENKVAVAVNCSVDRDGVTVPLLICWKDGRQFPIERVLHVCMEEDEEGERIRYAVKALSDGVLRQLLPRRIGSVQYSLGRDMRIL